MAKDEQRNRRTVATVSRSCRLDVVLQGEEDGWDVLDALKRDPQTQDIPIVIHSVTDNPRRAEQLGADGVVRKPVEPAALRGLIGTLLARMGHGPERKRPA